MQRNCRGGALSAGGGEGEDKWMHCRELQEERAGPDAAHHISTGFTISDMLRSKGSVTADHILKSRDIVAHTTMAMKIYL